MAALPVAPYATPPSIRIPDNMPIVETGMYKRAAWLELPRNSVIKMNDYIGTPRRRGNIVSFYKISRWLNKDIIKDRRLPSYRITIRRFNCQNDTYSMEPALSTISAWGDIGNEGGIKAFNPLTQTFTRIRGQVRVTIEGRPYWAMTQQMNPVNKEEPLEWISVRPNSIGASMLDYACTKLKTNQ